MSRAVSAHHHAAEHADERAGGAMQTRCAARDEAHKAIALACRIYGRKRGFHAAAEALQRSDRWVHGFHYHDQGAAPDDDTTHTALMAMRRTRAAQLRAELAEMEVNEFADELVARARSGGGTCG